MLVLSLAPAVSVLTTVRRAVHTWAEASGFDPFPLDLVAVELVTNAIKQSPVDQTVSLVVDRAGSGHEVEVRVEDRGPGFRFDPEASPWSKAPPASQERGRGLFLVDQLSHELRVERDGDRTIVTARVEPAHRHESPAQAAAVVRRHVESARSDELEPPPS